jgi:hypothetical protein
MRKESRMPKLNCWEYKDCGRQPFGKNVKDMGQCLAATCVELHGTHGGKNAGRACWVVAGTLCGGEVQGNFAKKLGNCIKCDFFQMVIAEEGDKYILSKELLPRLHPKK